jgi:hypothetical protein
LENRAGKRLKQLQKEYDREVKINSEGVGAVMAYTDLTWVVQHFGLQHPYPAEAQTIQQQEIPPTPQSPRSPVGGKLGEKLRGLKLATSPSELTNMGGKPSTLLKILIASTVAYFLIVNIGPKYNQHYFTPGSSGTTALSRTRLPGSSEPGVASLDAMVEGVQAPSVRPPIRSQATDDELFALPMSPRSPEMMKSPFSLIK